MRCRGYNRAQDRLLLGSYDEVVPRCRGAEGYQSTRGQTLRVAERRYVISLLFLLGHSRMIIDRNCVGLLPLVAALAATGIIWVRYSFVINPVNYSLAAVSARYLRRFRLGSHASPSRSVGEPLRRLNWPLAIVTYCPVSSTCLYFQPNNHSWPGYFKGIGAT